METNSRILAGKIAWTEEPGRLPSIGSQELDTAEQLSRTYTPAVKGEIDSDTGAGTSTSHHITSPDRLSDPKLVREHRS